MKSTGGRRMRENDDVAKGGSWLSACMAFLHLQSLIYHLHRAIIVSR